MWVLEYVCVRKRVRQMCKNVSVRGRMCIKEYASVCESDSVVTEIQSIREKVSVIIRVQMYV